MLKAEMESESVRLMISDYDPTIPGSGLFPYQRVGPIFLTESAGLYNQNQLIVNVK